MSAAGQMTGLISSWLDTVARALAGWFDRLRPTPSVEAVENESGELTVTLDHGRKNSAELAPHLLRIGEDVRAGSLSCAWAPVLRRSRVEVNLSPSSFVFRPLELPDKAGEFLDGIVRAQLDRVTPWSPDDAVYAWTPPRTIDGGRIEVTVVATGWRKVKPIISAFAELGAAVVDIVTTVPGAPQTRVTVHRHRVDGGVPRVARMRRLLAATMTGAALLAVTAGAGSVAIISRLEDERQGIERRLAQLRATIRADQGSSNALERLARRKWETPSATLVMEALADLLPDHTHAIELHLRGDSLQIVGLTQDAPSLISLLEQSPHFSRVAFVAPTTRVASGGGERFHIEARVAPHLEVRSP